MVIFKLRCLMNRADLKSDACNCLSLKSIIDAWFSVLGSRIPMLFLKCLLYLISKTSI